MIGDLVGGWYIQYLSLNIIVNWCVRCLECMHNIYGMGTEIYCFCILQSN